MVTMHMQNRNIAIPLFVLVCLMIATVSPVWALSTTQSQGGVFNGGFETGEGAIPFFTIPNSSGWVHFYYAGIATFTYDTTVYHGGKQSGHIHVNETGYGLFSNSPAAVAGSLQYGPTGLIPIKPSTNYRYTVWIKTNNSKNSAVFSQLQQFASESSVGSPLATASTGLSGGGTTDWAPYTVLFTTHSNAKYLAVANYYYITGNVADAWFDDITIEEVVTDTTDIGSTPQAWRPVFTANTSTDNIDVIKSGGTTDGPSFSVGNRYDHAQQFIPSKQKLTSIIVPLKRTGIANGTLTVSIQTDSGLNTPSGTILATNSLNIATLNNTTYSNITFDIPCLVSPNVKTWAVFDTPTTGQDNSSSMVIRYLSGSFSEFRAYRINGGAWINGSTVQYDITSNYAKATEDVTVVANGVRYNLSADQDGLLHGAVINLDKGYYNWTRSNVEPYKSSSVYDVNGQGSGGTTQTTLKNWVSSSDFLYPGVASYGLYNITYKINSLLPVDNVSIKCFFYSQNNASQKLVLVSNDNINWVDVYSGSLPSIPPFTNPVDVTTSALRGNSTFYVRQAYGTSESDFPIFYYMTVNATLNLSSINQTPAYLFPVNTAPQVDQTFSGSAASRVYFNTTSYQNANNVSMPALVLTDGSGTYISNYTLPFDNSQETNPAINILSNSTGWQQSGTGTGDGSAGYILNNGEYMTFAGGAWTSGQITYKIGKGTTSFSNITQNTFYLSSNGQANSPSLDPSHQMAISTVNKSLTTTGLTVAFSGTPLSGTPLNGTPPLTTIFTDTSSGSVTNPYTGNVVSPTLTNYWNFGDSNLTNSTFTNPVHTFYQEGTSFDITLNKLWYGYSLKSLLKPSYLTTNFTPVLNVNFVANTTIQSTYPMPVQFTDTSEGEISTWNWSFGDTYTSNIKNPFHYYNVAGKYAVTLNITNSSGMYNTTTRTEYINLTSDVDTYLKSWLHFNGSEGSTTFTDERGLAWLGTDGPKITTSQSKYGGASLDLTAAKSTISTATTPALNFSNSDFTLEFWVRPVTSTSGAPLITRTSSNAYTNGWGFVNGNGTDYGYHFFMGSDSVNATNSLYLPPNQWSFVVIQRESGAIKIYRDGILNVTKTGMTGLFDTQNPVQFGYLGPGSTYKFTGYFDEARITSGVSRWKTNFTVPERQYAGELETIYPDINPDSTLRFKEDDVGSVVIANQTNNGVRNRTIQIENITFTNYILGSMTYDPHHLFLKRFIPNQSAFSGVTIVSSTIDNSLGIGYFNITRTGGFATGFDNRSSILDAEILYWNYTPTGTTSTAFFGSGYLINGSTSQVYPIHNFIVTQMTYGGWDFYTNFIANNTNPQIYQPVLFTDLTVGYPNQWNLSFGDGTYATSLPATHTYTSPGLKTVVLTESIWQEPAIQNVSTRIDYINVTPIYPPDTEFAANVTNVVIGQPIQFTDYSANIPTSWQWTFGDGGISSVRNPIYSYSTIGAKTVTLNATNLGGSDTMTKTNYIMVSPAYPAPIAAFIALPVSNQIGSPIQFYDTSANTPTSWNWSFGDGLYSTLQSPSHIYTMAGSYTISLTATNAYGSDSETKVNYITITTPYAPQADFNGTPTSTFASGTVQFHDNSLYSPTSWLWSFGDGIQSVSQNPAHVYTTAGTYTVALVATNAYGTDTETKIGYITITGVAPTTPPLGYVITKDATAVSNNTVTMNGWTSSASYKYYFEYGYDPGVYAYATAQTTGTDPAGNFSETVTGLPLLTDETYFYRAVITEDDHYISGNELSYTLTQSEPLDVYPEYKTRGEALITANWDFETFLVLIPSPFVDTMGMIFYGILIGGAFILLWARTHKIIIPSLFGILSGGLLWSVLPPEWVAFGSALFYVSIAGFLYGIILGRQS